MESKLKTNSYYDMLNIEYEKFYPVFEKIKEFEKSSRPVIIAIEGRCCSGKSTLAALLKELFDCNVFHMDDFFLPFKMKKEERLRQPGGNVHYERFIEEVLIPLQKHEAVNYHHYNCLKGELCKSISVKPKKLTIVEGSYSMHSSLQQAYDYKIFLTVDSKIQIERVLKRNGEKMLKNFITKWIPLEENYFSILNIKNKCDITIDTTDF